MARYGRRDYGRYDAAYRDGWYGGEGYGAWYPGAFWAGGPMFGWGAPWGWPPYAPVGVGRPPVPRRSPRESPAYGRGGDREVRRWARSHGYDAGYEIPPREEGRPRPPRGREERAFRRWW